MSSHPRNLRRSRRPQPKVPGRSRQMRRSLRGRKAGRSRGSSMKRLTHSLAVRLTAFVVGGTALLFALYGYWNLRTWRQSQQEFIFQSADRISDTIRRSIRYSMLRNERDNVFQIISTIGHENGIHRIRIFNKQGE